MSRQRVIVTSAIAVVAFVSGGWLMQQENRPGQSVYQQARLFDDVLSHVADYYVDSLSEQQLYRYAIDGMLRELRDPYTGFLDGRELRALSEQTTGNYGGVGLQIDYRDRAIVVLSPMADTPAERAGIAAGDRIVEVDDSSTAHWDQERSVRALRGPPGTQVRITVARPGVEEQLHFTVTRAQIHARSVRSALMLDSSVAYLELQSFSEATARELTTAMDSLHRAGMRSLVLDLRLNPGGLLSEGVAVADVFLDPEQPIVLTRGRAPGSNQRHVDRAPQRWPRLPIVVLLSGYSASAAEIVAGALQDHDRALLIGTTSFGKGVVQSVFRLSSDASLKLTTSKWYTPSGRSIQRAFGSADEEGQEMSGVRDSVVRDTFRTDHGRIVRGGGGGITPDVIVGPDSLELAARRVLENALGRNLSSFADALAAFAFEVKARRLVSRPTFEVSNAMLSRFQEILALRGVTLDERVLASSRPYVARLLGDQIARLAFGREFEVRRQAVTDPVLAEAYRLASRARTPASLFELAGSGWSDRPR